mgnify:CR=1 FL=1
MNRVTAGIFTPCAAELPFRRRLKSARSADGKIAVTNPFQKWRAAPTGFLSMMIV